MSKNITSERKLNDMTPEVNTPAIEYNIEFRMSLLIQDILDGRNDWKRLEEMTGIKSVKWRHLHAGVTRASIDMLEALTSQYPHYAFWLATGLTDYEAGHTAPTANVAFPDSRGDISTAGQEATRSYFRLCRRVLKQVWQGWMAHLAKRSDLPESKERLTQLYQGGVNVSLQLGAEEQSSGLGKDQQIKLLKEISKAQHGHYEEMIARMRDRPGTDAAIDQQRARDAEIVSSVEGHLRDGKKDK